MEYNRERWVDNIKMFACVMVALGHLVQGIRSANIVDSNAVLQWFEGTVYYFHVQLFFVCSGYLYQKTERVNTWSQWRKNVLKKLASLGIPYIAFASITWALKASFSETVNSPINNYFYDLFIHPLSPYWYLFALFFIFLFVPTFQSDKSCLFGIGVAVLLKFAPATDKIYVLRIVADNVVWFTIGMSLSRFNPSRLVGHKTIVGVVFGIVFIGLSILAQHIAIDGELFSFAMGILGCSAVVILFYNAEAKTCWVAQYTMPIYLMHTIFAAGLRSVLFAVGIQNAIIHILVGLIGSFICPIIAMDLMKKVRLDCLVYPWKYLNKTPNRG